MIAVKIISIVCFICQADIYFSASPPKSSNPSAYTTSSVQPPSPIVVQEKTSLYKISTISLMGQFLDPPLARKTQDDAAHTASNTALDSSGEELSVSRQLSNSSFESQDTFADRDIPAKEPASRTNSCPQARNVSEPVDQRGAVKYSSNGTWTTVWERLQFIIYRSF